MPGYVSRRNHDSERSVHGNNLNVRRREWIKEMWYTLVMDYHPAIKKAMPLAATWLQLEVILSEVRKTDKYQMTSPTRGV